jgi:hypothetical protein
MFARDYMRRNIMELGEHIRKTRRRLPFMNSPGIAGEGVAQDRRRQMLEELNVTRDHVQMFLLTTKRKDSNEDEVSTLYVCMSSLIMFSYCIFINYILLHE